MGTFMDDEPKQLKQPCQQNLNQPGKKLYDKQWINISFFLLFDVTETLFLFFQPHSTENGSPPTGIHEEWLNKIIKHAGYWVH